MGASYYSGITAIVTYEGGIREMTVAVSGSGARCVGDGLEWWTKGRGSGSEGTLFRHENDGTTGEIIEMCVQASTGKVQRGYGGHGIVINGSEY